MNCHCGCAQTTFIGGHYRGHGCDFQLERGIFPVTCARLAGERTSSELTRPYSRQLPAARLLYSCSVGCWLVRPPTLCHKWKGIRVFYHSGPIWAFISRGRKQGFEGPKRKWRYMDRRGINWGPKYFPVRTTRSREMPAPIASSLS